MNNITNLVTTTAALRSRSASPFVAVVSPTTETRGWRGLSATTELSFVGSAAVSAHHGTVVPSAALPVIADPMADRVYATATPDAKQASPPRGFR